MLALLLEFAYFALFLLSLAVLHSVVFVLALAVGEYEIAALRKGQVCSGRCGGSNRLFGVAWILLFRQMCQDVRRLDWQFGWSELGWAEMQMENRSQSSNQQAGQSQNGSLGRYRWTLQWRPQEGPQGPTQLPALHVWTCQLGGVAR